MELLGSVASAVDRRATPAGTPVASFRLKVDADPEDEAVPACTIRVVVLSRQGSLASFEKGARVEVGGALAERRLKGPGGTSESRYEILARELRVID